MALILFRRCQRKNAILLKRKYIVSFIRKCFGKWLFFDFNKDLFCFQMFLLEPFQDGFCVGRMISSLMIWSRQHGLITLFYYWSRYFTAVKLAKMVTCDMLVNSSRTTCLIESENRTIWIPWFALGIWVASPGRLSRFQGIPLPPLAGAKASLLLGRKQSPALLVGEFCSE